MGTPSSSLRPPPEPSRTAIVDAKGYLTRDGWWFLYSLYKSAQNADDSALLEAIDAGTESALLPPLRDLSALAGSLIEGAPGVSKRQLEELGALLEFDRAAGASARSVEEARVLGEVCSCLSLLPRLRDLERLVAMLNDQPAVAAAAPAFINAAGPNGATPPGGTPVPPGTPIVGDIPSPLDPLSVLGNYILLNGVPYQFVPGIGAGPNFWQQVGGTTVTIQDTHANRGSYPAANYPKGTIYFETDRTLYYMVQLPDGVTPTWIFFNGTWIDVYVNLPVGLGANDRYLTFFATDYKQGWVWSGSVWHFAVGSTSGYFLQVFFGSPLPPGLWGLCDGSIYSVTQDDASLVSVTTPVVPNQYIRR